MCFCDHLLLNIFTKHVFQKAHTRINLFRRSNITDDIAGSGVGVGDCFSLSSGERSVADLLLCRCFYKVRIGPDAINIDRTFPIEEVLPDVQSCPTLCIVGKCADQL